MLTNRQISREVQDIFFAKQTYNILFTNKTHGPLLDCDFIVPDAFRAIMKFQNVTLTIRLCSRSDPHWNRSLDQLRQTLSSLSRKKVHENLKVELDLSSLLEGDRAFYQSAIKEMMQGSLEAVTNASSSNEILQNVCGQLLWEIEQADLPDKLCKCWKSLVMFGAQSCESTHCKSKPGGQ